MRILLSWQGCVIGGIETWMLAMARAFHSMGHECDLFFFDRGPFAEMIPADCNAHFGTLADLLQLVSRYRFDVVQSCTRDWDTGVSAVRRLGTKLVLHCNGHVHPAWNSSNCDAIVGCAVWEARAQHALTDLPVVVVPNGIDLERFRLYEGSISGPPIVAWVGRGSDLKQKQISRLAVVAPGLTRGARLWVADPDGPSRVPPDVARVLTATAERWESVAPRDMPAFYQQVAASGGCVLSTSRFEGLSLAYLEAQACGVPVIGPDVIGVNESLDKNRGGVLYPPDMAPERLTNLILRTLDDRQKMEWRRRACREFVASNFSIDMTARAYLRLYEAAPFGSRGMIARMRTRLRLSPFRWKTYVQHRWRAGIRQFAAAKQLLEAGKTRLAAVAMRASVATAPTIFVRPQRLGRCITALVHEKAGE
jgi:glycosyltransferase involved in cell wall biosynthesis